MLRLRSNSSVIWVLPSVLFDVIEVMPAMVENCRSSGAATEIAIVFGAGAGILRGDGDGRHLDARDGGDGQLAVAEEAGEQQRRHQQRRHHRAADADLGKAHVATSSLAAALGARAPHPTGAARPARGSSMVTVVPGARRSWPSVTTRSPAATPLAQEHRLADDALHRHHPRRHLVVGPDHPGDHALLRRHARRWPAPTACAA